MWELYFPSLFSFIFPFLQRVSHERKQEGFTKQERKNEGHKPSSCFIAFCLDIGLSLFWLWNAIVRSWICGRFSQWAPKLICQWAPKNWIQMEGSDLAKLSLQSQARWWSWRSLVFTRVDACPLVLQQVINLAGICTDKISLRRRIGFWFFHKWSIWLVFA
jgi:hypothetical protein